MWDLSWTLDRPGVNPDADLRESTSMHNYANVAKLFCFGDRIKFGVWINTRTTVALQSIDVNSILKCNVWNARFEPSDPKEVNAARQSESILIQRAVILRLCLVLTLILNSVLMDHTNWATAFSFLFEWIYAAGAKYESSAYCSLVRDPDKDMT